MDVGCVFAPGSQTPDHIAEAERLGFSYAYVYDSPCLFADAWMTLARAADRTSQIRLGVCVVTPHLRHVVTNAAAALTLADAAPGRVDIVVGAGFTSAALVGKKVARWASVEQYIVGLRALLAGEEIEWDETRIALTFPENSGLRPVRDVSLLVAAQGPKGFAVAAKVADGIVTNPGVRFDRIPFDGRCIALMYGTVLDDGESLSDPRVVDAAGPAAALALHLGDYGPLAGTEEVRSYQSWLASVPPERRHIELHREHLIGVTPQELPYLTPKVIEASTATGTREQVHCRIDQLERSGVTSIMYQPAGSGIVRELSALAAAAGLENR